MADLAREEELWWQAELARLAPQLLLPGRPVRGGGRSAGGGPAAGLAVEVTRLATLAPALQRRLLRHAAEQFGVQLEFAATEALRSLALSGRAGQQLAFPEGLARGADRARTASGCGAECRQSDRRNGSGVQGGDSRQKSMRLPLAFTSRLIFPVSSGRWRPEWPVAMGPGTGPPCATGGQATG